MQWMKGGNRSFAEIEDDNWPVLTPILKMLDQSNPTKRNNKTKIKQNKTKIKQK